MTVEKKLYTLLLIASLGYILSSCGSDEDHQFSLDGEWLIQTRHIACFGEGDAKPKAENLQKQLQQEFKSGMAANNYIYTFGDITDTQKNLYAYSEDIFKKDSQLGIPFRSISGNYERTGSLLTVITTNSRSIYEIKDLNNEYVMFVQNLNSSDLEIMLLTYFGINRKLDAGITGTMTTQAIKIKKGE